MSPLCRSSNPRRQLSLAVVWLHCLAALTAAQDPTPAPVQPEILAPSSSTPLVVDQGTPADAPVEMMNCPPPPRIFTNVSLSARTWISWGNSQRLHSANSGLGYASPISELKWRSMSSQTVEVGGGALIFDRFLISSNFGAGAIDGGHFQDTDFAYSGHQGVFSDTISPSLDDNLRYFDIDAGWRFFDSPFFSLDALVGYQYWRERYMAEGGSFVVPTGAVLPLPGGPVVQETFEWQGMRIGLQGIGQISDRFSFKARGVCIPGIQFRNEDIHFLRTDLLHDPSAIDRAGGGFGFIGDMRFSYWLGRGFFAEIGYRAFFAQSGIGETTIRTVNHGDLNLPFNYAQTFRQGVTLGLTYQF